MYKIMTVVAIITFIVGGLLGGQMIAMDDSDGMGIFQSIGLVMVGGALVNTILLLGVGHLMEELNEVKAHLEVVQQEN